MPQLGSDESRTLEPDEAFSVLGNQTRIQILQVLGEADGPLSFTDVREQVGIRQGSQFNYHLDRLVGHFVDKSDDGYTLRQPGRRVVEAVLSGAVTADPTVEPTEIDFTCRLCDAPLEISYDQERVEIYCTQCDGLYGSKTRTRASRFQGKSGYLGDRTLPAAGVHGRDAGDLLEAASIWAHLEDVACGHDICPRCSVVVDHSVRVCEDHDATDGLCSTCDRFHAVQVTSRCTNCIYEREGAFIIYLDANVDLRMFVAEHGIDPIVEGVKWGTEYGEEIESTDPFEARFTFTIDGDSISLTVNDELSVVDVTRRPAAEPD